MISEHPRWYVDEAKRAWSSARRKARSTRFEITQPGQTNGILDFNAISQRLRLRNAVYLGVQIVPLAQIVGSVGRYRDFNGAFLPADDGMSNRWQRIATLYLDPVSGGVPPVELYKVGAAYFVKDGNHRVSVAQELDLIDIEAYVWEYQEPVAGLPADADIDQLLIETERQEFIEKTCLDDLRPGHNIRLTAPGGYPTILHQIAAYQDALSRIDDEEVSWEKAVAYWYDMVYETTIQLLADTRLLDLFPDRTMADFFVFVKAHQQQLEERYDRTIMIHDAARDFRRQNRQSLPARSARAVMRWAIKHIG
jgi:hypothetical protein